jgi:glycosyltransferase involved in cell wall biosynthesis
MKDVSIILPTYNGARFIGQSIDSVLSQTFENFELIIIDDGSTDNTDGIVGRYSDKRIRYIKNQTNLGLQKSLNMAIAHARAGLIARIDDDDFWNDKNKLKKQIEIFEQNRKVVLVGTGMHAIDKSGVKKFDLLLPELDKDIRSQILSRTSFVHSSVCFKKETFLAVGGFDESENTKHVEDHDLWLRLGLHGEFYNSPSCSVTVRFREGSVIGKNFLKQQFKEMLLVVKYRNHYPNFVKALGVSLEGLCFACS